MTELSKNSQVPQCDKTAVMRWFNVSEKLPTPLASIFISNGKGWVSIGCLVNTEDGYHWAETNGTMYEQDGQIITECESDDLDVVFWHPFPQTIA